MHFKLNPRHRQILRPPSFFFHRFSNRILKINESAIGFLPTFTKRIPIIDIIQVSHIKGVDLGLTFNPTNPTQLDKNWQTSLTPPWNACGKV